MVATAMVAAAANTAQERNPGSAGGHCGQAQDPGDLGVAPGGRKRILKGEAGWAGGQWR